MDIKLNNICKSYKENTVLNNFSATIKQSGVTAFCGTSGCGKTTLLNILMGIEKMDRGNIEGLSNKKISVVFQEDRLLEWDTVLNNILFVMKKRDAEFAKHVLSSVLLSDCANLKANELSGGMKRRVAIARALAVCGNLLVLDEPFSGIDDKTKIHIMNLIKNYSENNAVAFVSHDFGEIKYLNATVYNMV